MDLNKGDKQHKPNVKVIGNGDTVEEKINFSPKNAALQKYEEEWTRLFREDDDPVIGELHRSAIRGNLRGSHFRSVAWRRLLDILPLSQNEWPSVIRDSRCQYKKLLAEHSRIPWQCDKVEDNPLSQDSESIWHQYFCDNELRALIRQDVVRTFPGEDYFRRESVQDSMVNILFCYAREHPAMCYRQGMHEVLAPLLFVLHCDHQAYLHAFELAPVSPLISEILDPQWLEADGYTLFKVIMHRLESCYRINDMTPTPTGYFPVNLQPSSPEEVSHVVKENEVVSRLDHIRDEMLYHVDSDLCRHLQKLNISPQLFGIRWLRLLFGREFALHDLLVLWDAIFAEGNNFELVDYVVVSMLLAIKDQLMRSDYTTCLTYLMRYSAAVDVTQVIDKALILKNSENFDEISTGTSSSSSPPSMKETKDISAVKYAKNTSSEQNVSTTAKTSSKSNHSGGPGRMGRWVRGRSNRQINNRVEGDAYVVDGFALDDPALLRQELDRLRKITALCQIKLQEYHMILSTSGVQSPEVALVTNGIHELCSLLHPRPRRNPSQTSEVEPALEADETKRQERRSMVEMNVIVKTEEGDGVVGAPLPDPTALRT